MASRTVLKIGDVFEIALPDSRVAYCHYIHRNEQIGYLVEVYRRLSLEKITSVEELKSDQLMFPPVFVGLQATARSGRWKRVGNISVLDFKFPKFRRTMGTKPGTHQDWSIWDGTQDAFIGKLPQRYRALELKCVWGDEALEERIVHGTYRGEKMF